MNKRNIIIAIIFAVFSLITVNNATAQLNGTSYRKSEKVLRIKQGTWLYNTMIGYEIWSETDNQFDNTFNTINLGETKEECLQTLNDLIEICENELLTIVEEGSYYELVISGHKELGINYISFREEYKNAGYSILYKKHLTKLIEWFENNLE